MREKELFRVSVDTRFLQKKIIGTPEEKIKPMKSFATTVRYCYLKHSIRAGRS